VRDFSASFEAAVVDQLLGPLDELASIHRPQLVTAAGGVAANTLLRERLLGWGASREVEVLVPDRALTTDNAAMIARAGQIGYREGRRDDPRRLDARAREAWQPPGMRVASERAKVESSGEAGKR
jgi:N6-L-threonylcarbamoyladenine synthase